MKNNISELGKRLKLIRKEAGYKSQLAFAEELGTTRSAYSKYEVGDVLPADTVIQLICTKFNINEHWLRTGEGEMMAKKEDSFLAQLADQYHLDAAQLALVRSFLSLDSDRRNVIIDAIKKAARDIADGSTDQSAALDASCGGTGGKPGESELSGGKTLMSATFAHANKADAADAHHLTDEQRKAIDKELSDYKQELEAEATFSKSPASTTSPAKRA